MKIAYVVSMFPCWSETFILNELVEHDKAKIDLQIYSLKKSSEKMIHTEALPFLVKTVYPLQLFNPLLWIMHLFLVVSKPGKYFSILRLLLKAEYNDPAVKMKSMVVFFLSPAFINNAQKRGIDHLHAHFATYPALLAWIVSSFCDTSFSVTAHAHDIYINQDILHLIRKRVSKVFTISQFNKTFISENVGTDIETKTEVLHCGINVKQYSFRDKPYQVDGKLQILSIGRLSGIKGFPWLFKALALLRDEEFPFHCNIIGDGPLRDSLQEQVRELKLEQFVSFLGSRKAEEIPGFFKTTDIFVLSCSRDKLEGHDGIPLVFMEAMAQGIPVVGTKLSGIPELIRHGKTGLCANVDDPESIKKNLVYLLEHPEEAEEMRYAARKLVENDFNIKTVAARLRDFFVSQH